MLVPCVGFGTTGQMFSVIDKVKTAGFNGGYSDGGIILSFRALQVLIMLVMIGISVYKPWQVRHQSSDAGRQ